MRIRISMDQILGHVREEVSDGLYLLELQVKWTFPSLGCCQVFCWSNKTTNTTGGCITYNRIWKTDPWQHGFEVNLGPYLPPLCFPDTKMWEAFLHCVHAATTPCQPCHQPKAVQSTTDWSLRSHKPNSTFLHFESTFIRHFVWVTESWLMYYVCDMNWK